MSNDKLKQLIDTLANIGYEISELDDNYHKELHYGDIEIILHPIKYSKNSLSKEIMLNIINCFYSLEYGIVTYDLFCEFPFGDVRLILDSSFTGDNKTFLQSFENEINKN